MNDQTTSKLRISVRAEGALLAVSTPYVLKDEIKALPGAQWNREFRVWTLPASPAAVGSLLDLASHRAIEIRLDGRAQALAEQWRTRQQPSLPLPVRGRTPAWRHQEEAIRFAWHKDAVMLAMEMGTGKSKVAVDLMCSTGFRKALVLAPKKAVAVWPREFARHAAIDVDLATPKGATAEKKAESVRFALDLAGARNRPVVIVLNHELAWRPKMADLLLGEEWDFVVWDESHRGKTDTGRMSLFMQQLHFRAARKLCLTGTPMPHSPLDIFSQYRFLDPGIFGPYGTAFRKRYDADAAGAAACPLKAWRAAAGMTQEDLADAVDVDVKLIRLWELGRVAVWPQHYEGLSRALKVPQVTFEAEMLEWRAGHERSGIVHESELMEKFYSIAYRVGADVLDLPEEHYITVDCEMDARTAAIYREILEEFYARIEGGEVSPSNALAQSIRLRQICAGHIRLEDGKLLRVSDHKRDALLEILQDVDEPVVVFCAFRPDLEIVHEIAAELGRASGEISGAVNDLTPEATMPEWCDVMACMIQSGGTGIDLTRAALAVDFSGDWSLTNWLQSRKRVHRPGQTRATRFMTLVTKDTIEGRIIAALKERRDIIETLLTRQES